MATSTELLRAAEHMESRAHLHRLNGMPTAAFDAGKSAYLLREEAQRLQAIETEQPTRSWPEGWPPFAVLRRAYESLGVPARPSTKWLESHGYGDEKTIARAVRWEWTEILRFSNPSTP